jgi:hypothetical protein
VLNETGDAGVFEDGDGIDTAQGGDDFGAIEFGVDGAVGTFEGADGGVGIDGDDKGIPERAGLLQVAHMSGVQEVKATVGEDETAALLLEFVPELADVFGGCGLKIRGGHERG